MCLELDISVSVSVSVSVCVDRPQTTGEGGVGRVGSVWIRRGKLRSVTDALPHKLPAFSEAT